MRRCFAKWGSPCEATILLHVPTPDRRAGEPAERSQGGDGRGPSGDMSGAGSPVQPVQRVQRVQGLFPACNP